MALDQREAEALADAIATVSAHYDVDAVVPPEALAWFNLVQTAGFIYGPRVFAARMRKRTETAAAAAQQSGEWYNGDATGTQGHAAH